MATLTGLPVETPDQAAAAAQALAALHRRPVLAKGGHLAGDRDVLVDQLVDAGGVIERWSDPRIDTRHTHGTGCTLASAIATGLGAGLPLAQAITQARAFVRACLFAAPGLGGGHGPMGHAQAEWPAV